MATNRYCFWCRDETQFNYNPVIKHSECSVCGSRFGLSLQNKVYLHFKERLDQGNNISEIKNLRNKIRNQKKTIRDLRKRIDNLKGGKK